MSGIEETSLRALVKLEQVLPPDFVTGSGRSRGDSAWVPTPAPPWTPMP